MVSRGLVRRALLLGIWAIGVLFLLELREPGFWREALELGERGEQVVVAALDEAVPGGAERQRSAPPSAVAGAAPDKKAPRRAELVAAPPPTPRPESARAAAGTATRDVAAHPGGAARARVPSPPDPLYARVGEVWRLDAAGEYARAWAIARTLPEGRAHPEALRAKALTALWAGEDAEARRLLRARLRERPGDVEARLALAQAELAGGRTRVARELLVGLARDPALGTSERFRLGALQEWAGDPGAAIESYAEVVASSPAPAEARDARRALPRLLEAQGRDLEARAAIAAARHGDAADADLDLLGARVAAKLGERREASAAYAAYVAAHPDDVAGKLEAARFAVNAGEPELAVARYEEVAAARGAAGLRVEMARALLAAGRYEEAEAVARAAIRSRQRGAACTEAGDCEDGPEARLALAQSVHLQGRPREAARLFADVDQLVATAPAGSGFRARLALARDRDLEAYGLLGDQLEGQAPPEPASDLPPAELWLLRGRVAQKRGDLRRARHDYERAADLGALVAADVALEALARETRPAGEAAYTFFKDANRLEVNGGALWADLWPSGAARVTFAGLAQVVEQRGARFTRTGGSITVADVFPVPEVELDGSIGFVNSSAGGGDIATASLGARRYFADGSVLGLTGYREPLLGGHEDLDPRLWNRIIDLESLGPSFAINGGKLYLDAALREEARDRAWVQLGAENYEDGNLRGIFYAHYQLPLRTGSSNWTVVRPNAFFEAFKRSGVPAYFSPSTHATLGVAGHTVQSRGRFRLEAELNPQLLVTEGTPGFGVHALLDASVRLGDATTIGASAFAFYDSIDAYWLARAMARVVVRF